MHSGNVSEHFSWYEVEFSDTAERLGIDNTVPTEMEWVIAKTALQMERIRWVLVAGIKVNSWYRGPVLQQQPAFINPTSQHPKGEAVDFVSPAFGSPLDICRKIIAGGIVKFDQLILEHTWVHFSYNSTPGATQRGQILSLLHNKKYALGLTNPDGVPY
jgi:putative chitinase